MRRGRLEFVSVESNKKSPRPKTDPEDCTRFFILARSPAHEGTTVSLPGRSSGSWFDLLPAPSQHTRETYLVNRISRHNAHASRFTNDTSRPRQWQSRVSSPFTAAGPRGICTLFPYPKVTMSWHNRREGQNLSSSILSDIAHSVHARAPGGVRFNPKPPVEQGISLGPAGTGLAPLRCDRSLINGAIDSIGATPSKYGGTPAPTSHNPVA